MNQIIWSEDAGNEFLDILSYYLEKYGKEKTLDISERIIKKIEKLPSFPKQGKISPELYEIGITEIREIIELPWRIFYKVESTTIYIISILDSRRNIEELLYKKVIDGKIK